MSINKYRIKLLLLFFNSNFSQTLLEQIIEQAQHFFMRLRTEYVIDTLAKEVN